MRFARREKKRKIDYDCAPIEQPRSIDNAAKPQSTDNRQRAKRNQAAH
jgi:hypothetical protein